MGNIVCKRFVPKPRSNIYFRFYVTRVRDHIAIDEEWAARFPLLNVDVLNNDIMQQYKLMARYTDGKMKRAFKIVHVLENGTVEMYFFARTNGLLTVYEPLVVQPTDVRMFQFLSYTERKARNRMLQIVLRNAEKADDGNYFGRLGMDLCTRICFWLVEDVRWRKRGEPRERC